MKKTDWVNQVVNNALQEVAQSARNLKEIKAYSKSLTFRLAEVFDDFNYNRNEEHQIQIYSLLETTIQIWQIEQGFTNFKIISVIPNTEEWLEFCTTYSSVGLNWIFSKLFRNTTIDIPRVTLDIEVSFTDTLGKVMHLEVELQ